MNKQIAKIISVLELIVAVVMYFAVAYQFDNDPIIMKILPYTDFEATLLRLSIYIIPGINIIAGFFGITFNTKGILCFAGVLELLAAYLTLYFKGKSEFHGNRDDRHGRPVHHLCFDFERSEESQKGKAKEKIKDPANTGSVFYTWCRL